MPALVLTLTDVGLAAIAGATGADPARISQLALSNTPFDLAPTLTGVPGEFKRIDAVGGEQVSPAVTHMTAYDQTEDVWTATGFGLFLEDGTLFAAYSSETPIMIKAAPAFALFSLDIQFAADVAAVIDFGDPVFFNPPASETVRGVAKIATEAETLAGTDDTKFVTPAKLASKLAAFFSSIGEITGDALDQLAALVAAFNALLARTIIGTGLATGGGDLSTSREINVAAATQEETEAGIISDKAVTPAGLTGILATIAGLVATVATFALKTITITGGGLVSGGGDLTANRVLTVTECSAADIAAGISADTVVTPRRLGPIVTLFALNGYIRFFGLQLTWGRFSAAANGATSVIFPLAFQNACFSVVNSGTSTGGTNAQDNDANVVVSTISRTGFSVFSSRDPVDANTYIAVGY